MLNSDTREPYAVAFARDGQYGGWAEIKVVMRNLVRHTEWKDHIYNVDLIVRCSVSSSFEHVYGVKFALADSVTCMEFNEVAAAYKAMSAIDRKLKKMTAELGYVNDENFPEFCRRVLVAAGVRNCLYERKFNQGNRDRDGNLLADGIFGLPKIDPRRGNDFLTIMGVLVDDTLAKRAKQKVAA
ncbi:hypothetical protein [Burkholderia vietnamiensis]|uniref:hypothetical protein n=1 Tax=Burkholderia vietnamiensis TaxID=60552 RepID=UPI001CB234BF|nr:hypothetical protein [Burkholderia vietnamiensis]CAG9228564.1 hypothetical protein BVI1335_70058 [Burkholderia vietnamiensis]HDR9086400.1 hypothetical protein [Burkholderia vietnamiensis]